MDIALLKDLTVTTYLRQQPMQIIDIQDETIIKSMDLPYMKGAREKL